MEAISSNLPTTTISLPNIVRAVSGQNRVSFPVDSTSLVYANFKNIRTMPAFGNSSGYSISRLRILDNMIEQLNRLRENGKSAAPDMEGLSGDRLDELITEYSTEIRNRLEKSKPFALPVETTGLVFDFLI